MSSNLKVNTILPSTGTTIGIGTVGGLINVVGNIDVNSTSGISTFNGLEISGIVTAKAGAAVTYYGDGSNLTGITDNVVTINNNANNRIITGSGSANTLEGESTFTYGGSAVTLTNSNPQIRLTDTDDSKNFDMVVSGGNAFLSANSSGMNMVFEVTGSERLRIAQSKILKGLTTARGNYGNNASGVEYGVQIEGTTAITAGVSIVRNSNDANDGGIVLGKTRATSNGGNTVVQAGDDLGNLTFAGNDGSTMLFGAEIFAEVQSGVGNDDMPADLIFKTNGGSTSTAERLRILSAGGITFNGDTAAANALDDYEEGSWTPAFQNNSQGGTFPISTYIRIGRLVSISFHATVGGGSGSSGFKVTGLPFSPDKNGVAPVATNCNIACFARIFDSSNRMEVHKFDSSDITYANLSDKFIIINATYRCNP